MKVAYLANIGTRDVMVDGQYLNRPRAEGERLLQNYDKVWQTLAAPILWPGLQYVLSLSGNIERVYLFASDQDKTVEEKFRDKDTVYFGNILERWLPQSFPEQIMCVIPIPIPGNPADYNRMNQFFAQRLPELIVPSEWDVIFIATVGGADASNMTLLYNAVQIFHERCQLIYVMPNGEVLPLDLGQQMLREQTRSLSLSYVERYDYLALANFLRLKPNSVAPWGEPVARYAAARLHFDFQSAQETLEDALHFAKGEVRLKINSLKDSLLPFLHEISPPKSPDQDWRPWLDLQGRLMVELYFNLRLKYIRGEFVDFLSRLFRLHEAVLRYIFEEEASISTDKGGEEAFRDYIHGNSRLQDFLEKHHLEYWPTTRVLAAIIDFWVTQEQKGSRYGPVYRWLQRLEKLSELRHKSIGAHGYLGVSHREITERWGSASVVADLAKVLGHVGLRLDDDPFAQANLLLREALQAKA